MLINRNKLPGVTIFKHKDVMDSYVSKNETSGIITEIVSKLVTHDAMINDNIGFEYSLAPREAITEISKNIFKRHPLVDDVYGLTKRTDSSMGIEEVLSMDRSNNVIGAISSDNLKISDAGVPISNIMGLKYGKISYGEKSMNDVYSFDPYSEYTLTDVVKSFLKDTLVFSVHRGGYITVYSTDTDVVDIINFTETTSYYKNSLVKNETYFNKTLLNSLVINASFNGVSSIVITTSSNTILFNMNDNTFITLPLTLVDEVITDIKMYSDMIYFIINTNDKNYKIKSFNVNNSLLVEHDITNKDISFFPNTIVKIGSDIVLYESIHKFGKHIDTSIRYIQLMETEDSEISTIDVNSQVYVSMISGSSVNSLEVGLVSNIGAIDRTMVYITGGVVYLYDENMNTLDDNFEVAYNGGSEIITYSSKYISIIFIVNGIIKNINTIDICKDRNSGLNITDCFVFNNECIVTFDDNTYRIISLGDLYENKIFINHITSTLSVSNNNRKVYFYNDKLVTVTDNDLSSLVITPHLDIFTQNEYDNIQVFEYINMDVDTIYLSVITKSEPFTRITMMSIVYTADVPDLTILASNGFNAIIDIDISLIRHVNNTIIIPVIPQGFINTFLISCDFDKSIIIRNILETTSDFTSALFINLATNRMSFGIDSVIYECPLNTSLFNVTDTESVVKIISAASFIDNAISSIPGNSVVQNYAELDNDNLFINELFYLNNNVIVESKVSKYFRLGDTYLFVSNKDVKLFDNMFKLKSIMYINDDIHVLKINDMSNGVFILNTNIGDIRVDISSMILTDLTSVIYHNKNIKHKKTNSNIVLCDGTTVSIIDTATYKINYDILNNLSNIDIQLDTNIHTLRLGNVVNFNDNVFIGLSIIDIDNYYLGSFVLVFNTLTDEISIITLSDFESPVIQENTTMIDSSFVDMVIIDTDLYISYYENNRINCLIIHSDMSQTLLGTVFVIPDNTSYIAMIATVNDLRVLLSDNSVITTPYTVKTFVSPVEQLLTVLYKVVINNDLNFNFVIISQDSVKYIVKDIDNVIWTNIDNDITHIPTLFNYVLSNFGMLDMSIDLGEAFIFNSYTNECIRIIDGEVFNYVNGYTLYNRVDIGNYDSDLFFKIFTNGFAAFNNFSGLYRSYYTSFSTLGNMIVDNNVIVIDYELNKYSCVKNNEFTKLINVNKHSEDFISAVFCSVKHNTVQSINYVIDNDNNTILVADSKLMIKTPTDLILFNTNPNINESYYYRIMENNTSVILLRTDDAKFGYKQCIFIDNTGSYHTIDMYVDYEIKPIYVDNDGVLHSIVKNNSSVMYMMGTDISSVVTLNGYENVIDAVKVHDIDNSILLVNINGDLIVFDVTDNNGGLKYKSIAIEEEDIIGIPYDYTFVRIVALSNNYTCVVMVKNNQSGICNIIPDCRISLTLDILGIPIFEVHTDSVGILKFYNIEENDDNRFSLPVTDNTTGLSLYDCIKTEQSADYDINITVNIGDITIDGELIDNLYSDIHTYITTDKTSSPKIFMRDRFFIVQYGKNIIICEINDRYSPNFKPLYEIIQKSYTTTKIVTDVSIGGNNILLSFSDKTARSIVVKKVLDGIGEQVTFVDNGFNFYKEFKTPSINEDIKYFITEIGDVGYITDNKCFIYSKTEKQYINIKQTSEDFIKFYCIDPIYNRVYTVDGSDNFGYIDINNMEYVPVKAMTELDIINIVYTVFNTVEILTTVGIFIFINEKLHKITNVVPDGLDLIVYPFKEYSI